MSIHPQTNVPVSSFDQTTDNLKSACKQSFQDFLTSRDSSNTHLYKALAHVFGLVQFIRLNKIDDQEVKDRLYQETKTKAQKNTSTELMAIKILCPFTEKNEARLRKWERALIAANQEGQNVNSFETWIKLHGVGKAADMKSSTKPKDDGDGDGSGAKPGGSGKPNLDPKTYFKDKEPQGHGKLTDGVVVGPNKYFVQIAVQKFSGEFDVVYTSKNEKLLKSVMREVAEQSDVGLSLTAEEHAQQIQKVMES